MPFRSRAQERWAFASEQPFAKQWAALTDQKSLPPKTGARKKSNLDRLAGSLADRSRK